MKESRESLLAKRYGPDVEDADLPALERRIEAVIAELGPDPTVRYLGSIFLREDEGFSAGSRDRASTSSALLNGRGSLFDRLRRPQSPTQRPEGEQCVSHSS